MKSVLTSMYNNIIKYLGITKKKKINSQLCITYKVVIFKIITKKKKKIPRIKSVIQTIYHRFMTFICSCM